jgi:hypothetical protein
MNDLDADSVALRLLCEQAELRLERTRAAADTARRRVCLPDGTYLWISEDTPPDVDGAHHAAIRTRWSVAD